MYSEKMGFEISPLSIMVRKGGPIMRSLEGNPSPKDPSGIRHASSMHKRESVQNVVTARNCWSVASLELSCKGKNISIKINCTTCK